MSDAFKFLCRFEFVPTAPSTWLGGSTSRASLGGVWDELDARLQFEREMEREYHEDMAWFNAP